MFYLDKSVQDKTFVRTLQRRNNKPYAIEGVVERFSEAYIEIVIPKDYSDIHVNGVFKYGQEFYVSFYDERWCIYTFSILVKNTEICH